MPEGFPVSGGRRSKNRARPHFLKTVHHPENPTKSRSAKAKGLTTPCDSERKKVEPGTHLKKRGASRKAIRVGQKNNQLKNRQ
jgi:hypothetical protein